MLPDQFKMKVDNQVFKTMCVVDTSNASWKNQKQPLSFFDDVRTRISSNAHMDDAFKSSLTDRLKTLSQSSLNILVVGSQGVGKTATLTQLFGQHDWDHDAIQSSSALIRHELNQLTCWEGLLPSESEKPEQADCEISALLSETAANGLPLVDLVLVVLDSSSANIDNAYVDIQRTFIAKLGEHAEQRLVVLMNKVDKVAQCIRGEDVEDIECIEEMMPLDAEVWLDCTSAAIRFHLRENVGIHITPLPYSAVAVQKGDAVRSYNLIKLMARLMVALPPEKRLMLLNQPLSQGDETWRYHDERKIYMQSIENLCFDALHKGARDGDRFGGQLGAFLGRHGRALGDIVSDGLRKQFGTSV
ncbi:hypothetical protein [Enterovibrio norvegicus]|uniref:hypothetical protein n=1 Tax=Enterovibrio norvegicus TaxID=188144 RepID=UPI000C82623B|nr:hypothetical protein [Enterovibrio norvegicus]PML80643.1 hypothetical protein BCT69_10515 [Enterovibrio norvegicus]